jgi:hypothetical protein
MRAPADEPRVKQLLTALAAEVREPVRVYLVGGATAVLHGWRPATVDVDFVFEPDRDAMYRAIASAKDRLDINVELASPAHFLPEVPGWREHSEFVGQFGSLAVFHYDLRAQVLAKIERDHERDRLDVEALLKRVSRDEVWRAFEAIRPGLVRFPAVDATSFEARVRAVLGR